jgi:hypothetical protein
MKQLKKTRRPVVLTVKGKAETVALDIAAQADVGEGIRQGLEDLKQGRVRPQGSFSRISKPNMAYRVDLSARVRRDLALL